MVDDISEMFFIFLYLFSTFGDTPQAHEKSVPPMRLALTNSKIMYGLRS